MESLLVSVRWCALVGHVGIGRVDSRVRLGAGQVFPPVLSELAPRLASEGTPLVQAFVD